MHARTHIYKSYLEAMGYHTMTGLTVDQLNSNLKLECGTLVFYECALRLSLFIMPY